MTTDKTRRRRMDSAPLPTAEIKITTSVKPRRESNTTVTKTGHRKKATSARRTAPRSKMKSRKTKKKLISSSLILTC